MVSISRNGSTRSLDMNGDGSSIGRERYVKHPLQSSWTLWYLENDRSKSWEDMQNKVTSFSTVEDFWSLHDHIRDPSELGDLNDYSLFKGNIRPMWEDKANKHGGRWILSINKQQHRRSDVDNMWLDTMLYMIGATSEYSNDINGAVVNVRSRGDKISVWTADCQNKAAITGIGHELKKYLGTDARLSYELHNSKSSKPLFTL